MNFKSEIFHIAKDITLTAEIAYFSGHPICKTKTIVLDYKGKIFETSKSHSAFTNLLLTKVLRPIYVIELINYLSRLSNNCNMFEIYNDEVTNAKFEDLELYTFGDIEEVIMGRAAHNQNINDFDGYLSKIYNSCYDKDQRKFNKNQLVEHMNSKFKYVNTSFNFDYIPIYGYVNSTGKASKTATPYLHLAVVFNILAHQDRFSAINNQEALASFNVIMRAKQNNVTASVITEAEYERLRNENDKLRNENAKQQDKIDELLEEVRKQTEKIDNQTQQLIDIKQQNEELKHQGNEMIQLVKDVKVAVGKTSEQYKSNVDKLLPDNAITTGTTVEVMFVWYNKDFDDYAREIIHSRHRYNSKFEDIAEDEVVLECICCQSSDLEDKLKKRIYDDADTVVFNEEINNSLDLFKNFNLHVPSTVARTVSVKQRLFRKIIVKRDKFADLTDALTVFATRNKRTKKSLTELIDAKHKLIVDYVDTKVNEIYEHEQQIVATVVEAVVEEVKQTLQQLLLELHPDMKQFKYANRFRNITFANDKPIIRYGTKNVNKYELTEDDIRNGKFR